MATLRETAWPAVRTLQRIWSRLREWSGDAAYERYLRASARNPDVHRPLNAQEFYLEQITRRYSQPNRCC
jgi:uncharacterized short protein YbdD (DUF466 family)